MAANHKGEVMASVDEEEGEFVIADISREGAWLTIRVPDAATLAEWC